MKKIYKFSLAFILMWSYLVAETVYVVNQASDDVSAIDPATNAVIATIPVGNLPNSATALPGGAKVYVPNFFNKRV